MTQQPRPEAVCVGADDPEVTATGITGGTTAAGPGGLHLLEGRPQGHTAGLIA